MSTHHGSDIPPGKPPEKSITQPGREDFAAVLDQVFILQPGEGKSLPLRLVAVVKSAIHNPRYDGFSLYFSAPEGEPALPDNSYFLENRELGRLLIHLSATPVDSGRPGDYEYEAVFNLRKP